MVKQEGENILKRKDLITEIQRMWNVKAKMMPVITGAAVTISKYLSNIIGKHEIKELKKQPRLALHTYYGKC
jgi:hypothetical protein